jgi:hypothetical protein
MSSHPCVSCWATASTSLSARSSHPPSGRGMSRGYASAPRVDYATDHGMPHTESGVFLT